jgi:hypothetical protein
MMKRGIEKIYLKLKGEKNPVNKEPVKNNEMKKCRKGNRKRKKKGETNLI